LVNCCEKNENSNQKCYREAVLKLYRPETSVVTDKGLLRLRLGRGFATIALPLPKEEHPSRPKKP